MLYVKEVVVPAGTPENSPVEAVFEIWEDVITRVDILFPAGVHNEVYVALFYGEEQILPSVRGEWITGNNETVSIDTSILLPDRPSYITVKAISPNANYDHTILIRINTANREEAMWRRYLVWLVKYLVSRWF